jgi:hypothetical protein
MKDAYEILRLKEIELSRVKAEVEALGIVAPLLSDDGDSGNANLPVTTRWTAPSRPVQVPKGTNNDPQPDHSAEWKARTAGFP